MMLQWIYRTIIRFIFSFHLCIRIPLNCVNPLIEWTKRFYFYSSFVRDFRFASNVNNSDVLPHAILIHHNSLICLLLESIPPSKGSFTSNLRAEKEIRFFKITHFLCMNAIFAWCQPVYLQSLCCSLRNHAMYFEIMIFLIHLTRTVTNSQRNLLNFFRNSIISQITR